MATGTDGRIDVRYHLFVVFVLTKCRFRFSFHTNGTILFLKTHHHVAGRIQCFEIYFGSSQFCTKSSSCTTMTLCFVANFFKLALCFCAYFMSTIMFCRLFLAHDDRRLLFTGTTHSPSKHWTAKNGY